MKASKCGKCSTAIWKKFSRGDKALWRLFYGAFHCIAVLPAGIKMTDEQLGVLAHNYACQAVWALQDVEGKD